MKKFSDYVSEDVNSDNKNMRGIIERSDKHLGEIMRDLDKSENNIGNSVFRDFIDDFRKEIDMMKNKIYKRYLSIK